MVKVDVVGRKLTRATDRLDKAERILSGPAGEFLADEDAQDLASFHLFLAIQECIDLALHWVVDEGWEAPDDAGSTFLVLANRKVIDRELAERMRDAVGLRNLIAHGYSLVDHARIQREYTAGIANLRRFLAATADKAGL
jgi:uncharacterized protein YutE (UPF0331/DUF86 family)